MRRPQVWVCRGTRPNSTSTGLLTMACSRSSSCALRPPGAGAGRPAKLYLRSSRELAVTLPTRRYEVACQLMGGQHAARVSDLNVS